MKRALSWLLTVCMLISMLSGSGLSVAFAATATGLENTDYAPLFDSASDTYAKTMLINPAWSLDSAVIGETDLSIVFRNVTVTEKYDENRHFTSFADAKAAWEARHTSGGVLQKTYATTVPNFVLAEGTYAESISIVGSANIYGAKAGITPNDPSFDVTKAIPTDTWAANPDRTGSTGETVLTGGINRSNYVGTSTTDTKYSSVYASAGVTSYNVVIDGVKFKTNGFTQKDIVSTARTSTVNVYNAIFDTVAIGLSAAGDNSANFNDYNVKNVRVSGMTNRFIYMYPRVVNIEGMAYQNNTARFYNGGSQSSKNDLWWKSKGGDRKFNFTVKGSVFANNNINYLFTFADNCHLNSYTMTFENNLFNNASYKAKYGTFLIYSYANAQGVPTFKATNNIFYTPTAHNTLFNGNPSYQANLLNYTLNNNRIIGYNSAFQNITSEMDSFLSSANWNYDNNYYADTFTSVNDAVGKAPAYDSNSATVQPVDLASTPYYFNYSMTVGTDTVKVEDIGFKDSAFSYTISNTDRKIVVVLNEGAVVNNPSFVLNTDIVSATLYNSETDKTAVTSVSEADITGSINYYLEAKYGDFIYAYDVIFYSKSGAVDFKTNFTDATGEIKNTAALLLKDGNFANGDVIIESWGGKPYLFTVGDNAFTSVDAAIKAGKTQVLLNNGEYGNINITGSVTLYGEDYATCPNKAMTDELTTPELNSAWDDVTETSVGTVSVKASATGASIVVKGVKITGNIFDNERAVSAKKTSVKFENIIYAYADPGNVSRVIKLNNANASGKDGSVSNVDEFAIVNSRFDFKATGTGYRLFEELCPSKVTLDKNVFCDSMVAFGYPKWQNNVVNGKYTFTNNYMKNIIRATGKAMYFEGLASNASKTGKNVVLEIANNTIVDCFNTAYNSDSFAFTEIYPGAYTKTIVKNNTFIDTNNYLGYAIKIASKGTYSPIDSTLLDTVTFENNRVLGLTPFLKANGVEGTIVNGNNNYYARFTSDYKTAENGEAMYGLLSGNDYYLDYKLTTKASDMEMVMDRELSMVNTLENTASIVLEKGETLATLKTADYKCNFSFYSDEDCNIGIGALKAEDFEQSKKIYAKATSAAGVSVVYELYVSVGSFAAKDPSGTGIENPFLYYVETENMPVGTKFVMNYKGTDYVFTAGVNAFASVSQITAKTEGTPNILLPKGVISENIVVTKTANFYGDGTASVVTNEPDTTTAVKIACVGDSITEGHGISESLRPTSSYPAQLQTKLDAKYGKGAYNVGNFGFGGSTVNVQTNRETTSYTYWTYIYTVQYYKSLDFNPEIVVIMMGHNDTHHQFYTTPDGYKSQYQQLIDTYTALPSHPTVVIAGCTGRAASIRQDYLTQTIIPLQKELARENGLTYIDMYSPTIDLVSDKTYFGDGLHGTVKGYGLIADLIMNGMSHLLTTTRSATKTNVIVDASQRVETTPRIKVACIGDSLTYGDKAYKGYPVYLQEMLGDAYEVRNFGECGAIACDEDTYTSGTNWCYKHYARYAYSQEWKPDIVLMMLGYNDQGGHLTNFHDGINWTGGASSTAAKEFAEDYKALVKEYVDLGATVYCIAAPSSLNTSATGTVNTYINPIIKATATELGLEYFDIWAHTNKWTADMYCGTNSTGTTDNTHFSAKGYKAVATYMFENIFSDFAKEYFDDLGEIKNTAMIVDLQAGTHANGDVVTYAWEGKNYKFVWGTNAFSTVNGAINKAVENGKTEVQILVPENTITTTQSYTFSISTPSIANVTSIEVFGQNRRFDPNDKSAASVDPTADWTRNPNWDMYSTKGGTSAIARIEFQCNANTNNIILAGKVKFKGITMRNLVWNSERKVGTAADPRSLDLIFENCLVDFTTTSASGGYLFNNNGPRGKSAAGVISNDSMTLKNFRVERYYFKSSGQNRIMAGWSSCNHTYLDGFYYNGNYNPNHKLGMFGWFQNAVANTESDTIVENSNFRNATVTLNVAPISNDVVAKGKSTVYHVDNNVFYNTGSTITTFAKYYTDFKVRGNYFVQTNSTAVFANNATHTATDVDYVKTIGYEATNNTFVLADLSSYTPITLNSVTNPDMTGTYVALYKSGYATAIEGSAPSVGKSDYYYLDFARTVKSTDLTIESLGLEKDVTNLVIGDNTITADGEAGTVITDLTVNCTSGNVTTGFYADADCKQALTSIDLNTTDATKTVYIKVSYGTSSKVYTFNIVLNAPDTFLGNYVDANGIVKDTAYAVVPSTSGKTTGDRVIVKWQGELYTFVYGVNVFASEEEINAAYPNTKLQIILPAGEYTSSLDIYGSWEVYGEGYATNPNDTSKDKWTYNTDWEKYGVSLIKNNNVIINAAATPKTEEGTTIVIAGIKLTKYYNDAQRTLTNYKTDITLLNCVYERCYLTDGNSRDFNFANANAKNTDTAYTNNDVMTIKNLHFINTNPADNHALAQEMGPATLIFDGLCIPANAPSWSYPKVTGSSKTHVMTLTNSYISGLKGSTAKWDFFISFSGHDKDVTSDGRRDLDTTLNITNNKFVNCGNESDGHDANKFIIQIFPQAYKNINITGNEVISESSSDYRFLDFATINYIVNAGDYSDNINFKNNRLIGVLPAVTVNADTEVDLSENYFAKYTSGYKSGVNGDIPADTDADYYLDYAMTVKRSDMMPASENISGLAQADINEALYGYAEAGEVTLDFAKEGVAFDYYSDEALTKSVTTVTVADNAASKVFVKATKGNTIFVYTLYVMGVDTSASVKTMDNSAVYYPTLYGAPTGIKVLATVDGTVYGFETGKSVTSTFADTTAHGQFVVVPDGVTKVGNVLSGAIVTGDAEYTYKDTVKVACVGDSITQGVGASNGNYPTFLQTELGTDNYEVKNFGKSAATVQTLGTSTERGYTTFAKAEYDASIAYKPDVVIFALGTNDVYAGRWQTNKAYVDAYIELIKTYQALETKPVVYVTTALYRFDNVMMNYRVMEDLHAMQKYVAAAVGGTVIDTYADMLPYNNTTYFPDKLHPNSDGYAILAKSIATPILEDINTELSIITGKAGPKSTYTFDPATGVLTVEGTGLVWSGAPAPVKELVKEIVFADGITEICDMTYSGYYNIEKVTLPEGLKVIGNWNFYGTKLTEISLPSTLTKVGDYAFGNSVLESVEFADTRAVWNNVTIGQYNTVLDKVICKGEIFDYPTETTVWVYDGVDTIYLSGTGYVTSFTEGNEMIPDDIAANIKHIVLDETIAGFGAYTFANMPNLVDVTGGENMRYVGNCAFKNCKELTTVEFTSAQYFGAINYGAFMYCESLESITLSEYISVIYGAAFRGCISLKEVVVPAKVETIGEYVFWNCTGLETLEIKGAKTLGAGSVQNCTALKSVVLPDTLLLVGGYAFYGANPDMEVSFNNWDICTIGAGNSVLKNAR